MQLLSFNQNMYTSKTPVHKSPSDFENLKLRKVHYNIQIKDPELLEARNR